MTAILLRHPHSSTSRRPTITPGGRATSSSTWATSASSSPAPALLHQGRQRGLRAELRLGRARRPVRRRLCRLRRSETAAPSNAVSTPPRRRFLLAAGVFLWVVSPRPALYPSWPVRYRERREPGFLSDADGPRRRRQKRRRDVSPFREIVPLSPRAKTLDLRSSSTYGSVKGEHRNPDEIFRRAPARGDTTAREMKECWTSARRPFTVRAISTVYDLTVELEKLSDENRCSKIRISSRSSRSGRERLAHDDGPDFRGRIHQIGRVPPDQQFPAVKSPAHGDDGHADAMAGFDVPRFVADINDLALAEARAFSAGASRARFFPNRLDSEWMKSKTSTSVGYEEFVDVLPRIRGQNPHAESLAS